MQNENDLQQPQGIDPIMSEEAEREFLPIIDLVVILSERLKFISTTILVFILFGFVIALIGPVQYTSSALVIREVRSGGNAGSQLSALRGLGLGFIGSTTGLNPETIPDILLTREVILAVARDKYYFDDIDTTVSFLDYLEITDRFSFEDVVKFVKRYTVRLPNTLAQKVKGTKSVKVESLDVNQAYITKDEKIAIKDLESMLTLTVDGRSGIMDIQVTTEDPVLSATLTRSYIKHLTERVRDIYTQKSRDQVTFIQARVEEAESGLTKVENDLAKFLDSNLGAQEERLKVEIDRLMRIVQFKAQLYQDLQTQLTQAELELQKADPVLTILEQPVPPLDPSGSSPTETLVIFGLLGIVFAPIYVLIQNRLNYMRTKGDNKEKFDAIAGNVKAMIISLKMPVRRKKAKLE